MTVNEKLKEMLVSHGLFPDQADKVLIEAFKDKTLAEIQNKQWAGYPEQFHAVCWMSVKRSALEYIDKECPQHWARGCFI